MYKKLILFISISFCITANAQQKPEISAVRQKIGPVYAPPVEYKNSIYFLASSGALYSSDLMQEKVKEIFKTKLKTVAEMVLDGSTLYFGEGTHDDKKSNLYAFDLTKNKLLYSVPVAGHIEKRPAVSGELLIVGLGPGGIAALNRQTGKIVWQMTAIEGKSLHIDSVPIIQGEKVYLGSIYEYKAILCLNLNDGKVIWKYEMGKSPKSDLILSQNKIISLASDGNLGMQERQIPSDLIVLDTKTGQLISKKELRGSNYFPQLILQDSAFVALSTGDIISVDLKNGKVSVVDQYPEPFLTSTFALQGKACAMSVLGRLFCYKDNKLVDKKELGEINMGKVSSLIQGRIYIPSRAGFVILPQ